MIGHSNWVNTAAVGPRGRWAVSGSRDSTLKGWDLETGRELQTLRGHSDNVFDVAVSADGQRAVSASDDQTLKAWDLESGRELHTLTGHSIEVDGVAVSADGRWAVSASWDETLKAWDLETGAPIDTFTSDVAVSACAFVTDNKIIEGDRGGRVHFLSLEQPKTQELNTPS